MSNERRQTALLALSTGLFFGWQFCLFPPMGAPVIFNALLDGNGALLAQMCVVAANVLACAALVVAVPRMSRELRPSRFMVASAIAQVAALALLAFAPTAAAKGVAVGVVSGAAVALGWACLILQYARVDVAVTEGPSSGPCPSPP